MEKANVKVKKWGNSFGVILPKKIVDTEKIKEGVEITITIEPNNKMTVGDLFEFARKHLLPKPKKSYKELLKEADKEFWPEE